MHELSADELVSRVGLSKQAAHNLFAGRPFQKIEELPKVCHVKKQAMVLLRNFAQKNNGRLRMDSGMARPG